MAERGVKLAHSRILRWVTRYVPEFEKRWNRFSRAVGTSWRVDETYISIKAKWHYHYRAVDKHGKTVDPLLRCDRGIAAAKAFFRKALASTDPRVPRKVTLDGHVSQGTVLVWSHCDENIPRCTRATSGYSRHLCLSIQARPIPHLWGAC